MPVPRSKAGQVVSCSLLACHNQTMGAPHCCSLYQNSVFVTGQPRFGWATARLKHARARTSSDKHRVEPCRSRARAARRLPSQLLITVGYYQSPALYDAPAPRTCIHARRVVCDISSNTASLAAEAIRLSFPREVSHRSSCPSQATPTSRPTHACRPSSHSCVPRPQEAEMRRHWCTRLP